MRNSVGLWEFLEGSVGVEEDDFGDSALNGSGLSTVI